MISKHYEIEKYKEKINFFLFYGENEGLIKDTINLNFKEYLSNNLYKYTETELLNNNNNLFDDIFSKSFFNNEKLILVLDTTDKSINLVDKLLDHQPEDTKFIFMSDRLDKKSKIRKLFEKNIKTLSVPFFEDNYQTLNLITQKFFKEKKITITIFGVGLGNWKLKSIDYDAKDIKGYIVPYHAHSDFIQLGAELGIIGFLLYLAVFLWAIYYVYRLIRFSSISTEEKVFLFLMLTALGVYSVDANLNFPIARPQVLVVWAMIMAMINFYYRKHLQSIRPINSKPLLNYSFLGIALLTIVPSIYVTNSVYESLKGQMFLLQDFNSNQFNVPLNKIDTLVPEMPNITVTTIPINSIKARYYFNARKYDKALALIEKGTSANPYLYYSELLKSQIFMAQGQLDSASVYAKKAFFGLSNNALHSSNYLNVLNQTRDRDNLEQAYELLVSKNDINNWRNYLTVASTLYPPKDKALTLKAKQAARLFPQDQNIQGLYRTIAIGSVAASQAATFSNEGLVFFNQTDYKNAALNFEKAFELNPLEFSYFENAATANYLIGNLQKALEQINLVINEMNPLNGKCEYIKALIFIKMQDPIGACPLLKTAVDSGHSPANATYAQYCNQ